MTLWIYFFEIIKQLCKNNIVKPQKCKCMAHILDNNENWLDWWHRYVRKSIPFFLMKFLSIFMILNNIHITVNLKTKTKTDLSLNYTLTTSVSMFAVHCSRVCQLDWNNIIVLWFWPSIQLSDDKLMVVKVIISHVRIQSYLGFIVILTRTSN